MGFVVLKAMIKLNGIKTENREPTLGKKGKYILFFLYRKTTMLEDISLQKRCPVVLIYELYRVQYINASDQLELRKSESVKMVKNR